MMHDREKSDSAIVAGKPTNKAVLTAAEPVERRAEAKGNASQQSTRRTQSRVSVSHALERIRQTVAKNALPSHTQGGSRMPEWGPYGSVRGALSNERPYRDLRNVDANCRSERSHRFARIQPNSSLGDYSPLSCGVGATLSARRRDLCDAALSFSEPWNRQGLQLCEHTIETDSLLHVSELGRLKR